MKKCLIFLEKNYEQDCLDLLGASAILFGKDVESIAVSADADEAAAKGKVDTLIRIPEETGASFNVRAAASVIASVCRQNDPDCVLIAATHYGRMLAPYTAALLECGLVADVTEVRCEEGETLMIRPAYGGRIMAVVKKTGDGPVMMSIRPGVFSAPEQEKTTKTCLWEEKLPFEGGIKLLERKEKPPVQDIRESEVLVSGGGGAMDHFDLLKALADRLGGTVSASRMAVDSGKADRIIQVGQSGKFVHPKLYIAEGIYGAIQHVAGIKKADHIIAVNTDPQAPICSLADIVVTGDAAGFTQKLIERIDREKNNAASADKNEERRGEEVSSI